MYSSLGQARVRAVVYYNWIVSDYFEFTRVKYMNMCAIHMLVLRLKIN